MGVKFKVGDHFKVKASGREGRIDGTRCNFMSGKEQYVVFWFDTRITDLCDAESHDPFWEDIAYKGHNVCNEIALPNGYEIVKTDAWHDYQPTGKWRRANNINEMEGCNGNHSWKIYDSGFTRFEYCVNKDCKAERKLN